MSICYCCCCCKCVTGRSTQCSEGEPLDKITVAKVYFKTILLHFIHLVTEEKFSIFVTFIVYVQNVLIGLGMCKMGDHMRM